MKFTKSTENETSKTSNKVSMFTKLSKFKKYNTLDGRNIAK